MDRRARVIALSLATLLAGCSAVLGIGDLPGAGAGNGPDLDGGDDGDAASSAAWRIGLSYAGHGALAGIGATTKRAVQVAQDYVNGTGGILGKPIEFVAIDDMSDIGPILDAATTQLLGDSIAAVIGPNGSSQVLAAQQAYAQPHVIEITPTAGTALLDTVQPAHDRFLFRTIVAEDLTGRAIARVLSSVPLGAPDGGASCSKLALVSYGESASQTFVAVVKAQFTGTVVSEIQVGLARSASYANEVQTLLASKPDCLALLVYPDVADEVLIELAAASTPLPFWILGGPELFTYPFIEGANGTAENVYGVAPDVNPATKEFSDFAQLFEARIPARGRHSEYEPYASNAFDAAMLIALAIAQAGGTSNPILLRDALYGVSKGGTAYGAAELTQALQDISYGIDIDYQGASGPVDIDDDGNVLSSFVLWNVQHADFQILARITASSL